MKRIETVSKLWLAWRRGKSEERSLEQKPPEVVQNLLPVTAQQIIQDLLERHHASDHPYGQRDRGHVNLLLGETIGNYTQFGEYNGQTALDYFQELSNNNGTVLELPVGEGNFLQDLIEVYGFEANNLQGLDLFIQREEYPYPFLQANIVLLQTQQFWQEFGKELASFDAVVSAALFHHLHHQFVALAGVAQFVKPGGRLYISTLLRPIFQTDNTVGDALDDLQGRANNGIDSRNSEVVYARNMANPRFITGELVFPGELWNLMNQWNEDNWHFQYGVINYEDRPQDCMTGRIVAQRQTAFPLNLDWMFYGFDKNRNEFTVICARDELEKSALRRQKFLSIDDLSSQLHNQDISFEYIQEIFD